MLDRQSEANAFKTLNLSLIASAHNFEIVKKKSTKSSVLMSKGADKIIITQKGSHYVFCSVTAPGVQGTAIDFVQEYVEKGCDMGRVRQILRPFLGGSYTSNIQQKFAGRFASEIKPNETDVKAVADRYSRFIPIAKPHPYLCNVRGIPAELLESPRIHGRIRQDSRGNIAFPHWGCPDGEQSEKRRVVGYEIIGPNNLKMFSKSGVKSLWMSAGMKGDHKIAVAESSLDALSFMAVHGEQGLRVASISGKMNPQQPEMLRSAIERMGEGSQIIAAFDNDAGGDDLTLKLSDIVKEVGRNDLIFKDDRPLVRGHDWNKVLMDHSSHSIGLQPSNLSLGR